MQTHLTADTSSCENSDSNGVVVAVARSYKGLGWPRPTMLAPSSTIHDLWLFPALHARLPSFGLQEPSFHLSMAILLGCLSTTRNDPLTAGTFHSVPRGRRAVMPSLQPSRIIYGRRRHSGIYHPSSSSPVFGWLAGSDVFDLTGVALFGRALFFSHLYSTYMEDVRQSNPLQQCHTTPPPSLPLSEYLKCRRRCPLLNYLK